MDKFLQFVGAMAVVGASFFSVGAFMSAPDPLTVIAILPWAVPAIVGGVVIAAFGAMLGELRAVRAASETQAATLRSILERMPQEESQLGQAAAL